MAELAKRDDVACAADADAHFGPSIPLECRQGKLDFTLTFEQAILSIPIAVFLLVLAPPRLSVLARRINAARGGAARNFKIAIATALFGLQVALLVLWTQHRTDSRYRGGTVIAAASSCTAAALVLVPLAWLEDAKSPRPSALISTFLLLSCLLDLPQTRTLWLLRDAGGLGSGIPGLFSGSLGLRLVFLLVEGRGKGARLHQHFQHLSPEALTGIIGQSTLWWLNSVFARGLRAIVRPEDLFELDDSMSSKTLAAAIQKTWTTRQMPERRFEYIWAVARAFWKDLLFLAAPRAIMIPLTFAQPFLISAVLNTLETRRTSQIRQEGYALVGAAALIYIGLAVSTLHYNYRLYRFIAMFRGATIAILFDRGLRLPCGQFDEASAVTLMSTDVDRIAQSLISLNELWARLIEVCLGVALLALQLGWVCIMPILVVLISTFGAGQIAKQMSGKQKMWVEAVQERVSITARVLSEMKTVKMLGLAPLLTHLIQVKRVDETNRMAGFRWNIVWQNVVQNMPWALSPALTFAVYVGQAASSGNDSIGTSRAFTSLSIITLLTSPASILLSAIPSTTACLGCFDRIQEFLTRPHWKDFRSLHSERPSTTPNARQTRTAEEVTEEIEEANSGTSSSSSSSSKGVASCAISASHLTIGVKHDTSDIKLISNVSFEIDAGSFTAILGSVGSGKSTLLAALLGEGHLRSGSISMASKRIAYCSQSVWLPNVSIREAICMSPLQSHQPSQEKSSDSAGAKHDETWYRTCLHACALDQDLAAMTEGDATMIGSSGGAVLSGGQKARVALARAIHSRCDFLFLDAVASALDARTKQIVGQRLFAPAGLLRKLGTLVILTASDEYLPYMDQVLVLDDGQVKFHGSVDEVRKQGLVQLGGDANGGNDAEAIHQHPDESSASEQAPTAGKDKAAAVSKENQVNDLSRATGDIAVYKYYLSSIGLWKLAAFVGSVVVHVFGATFSQIWLKWWSDADGGRLGLYLGIYFFLAVLNSLGTGGYVWAVLILISPTTARKMHYTLLKTVMRAPYSFFSGTDSGTVLNRFSQDMTLIESQLAIGLLITVSNFFTAIATAGLIATGSAYMAASVPLLIIVIFAVQHVYLRTSRQLRLLDLEARSPLYTSFLQTLSGLATIRAFGREKEHIEENSRLLDLSQRPYYYLYCIQQWLTLVLDLIVAAEAILVVGLAVGLQDKTGASSAGALGVSMNNVLTFSLYLSALVTGWTQLETSLGSIARVRDFELAVQPEALKGETCSPPPSWVDEGTIRLHNVTARYKRDGEPVLRQVDLVIQAGQKVIICGRTGSGKSSLVLTLLRMLELDPGSDVTVDGISITSMSRETVRNRLLTIPQDPIGLLPGLTLQENLALLSLNSETEEAVSLSDLRQQNRDLDDLMMSVLRRVGLWDEVFLPRDIGLDTLVPTDGSLSLSQGEQQLLALARVLLRRTWRHHQDSGRAFHGGILLLDEPTSQIDAVTEKRMHRILAEEFGGWTVLTVAHRLHEELLQSADLAVVLAAGRVTEVGSPAELRSRDGPFADLIEAGGS